MSTRVLVADDSKLIRMLIVKVLRDLEVEEVVQAADGIEAMEAFQQNEFDLVVLDWQMPGKCGLEVIEEIRATGSEVPILMVTATALKTEHIVDAVETGASDYLLKPFEIDVLREKLGKYCCQSC